MENEKPKDPGPWLVDPPSESPGDMYQRLKRIVDQKRRTTGPVLQPPGDDSFDLWREACQDEAQSTR